METAAGSLSSCCFSAEAATETIAAAADIFSFRQNRGLSKGSPLFIVNAHILTLIYAYRSLFIFSSVFPESDLPSGLFPFAFFSLRQERSIS